MKDNYIVRTIIDDAKKFADGLLSEAKTKAADKIRAVKKQLETDEAVMLDDAARKAEQSAEHQKALNEITVRKAILAQKQEALDDAFKLAKEELLKSAKSSSLLSELVKIYARKGDTVISSAKLPETLIKKFSLKQVIDKNIDGIILSNANYELKLTYDELLKNFRSKHESEIAHLLFGEG